MIYILIFIVLMFIALMFINNLLKPKIYERYTGLLTPEFMNKMSDKYIVDINQKTVKACNDLSCISKSYEKHFNSIDAVKLAKDKSKTSILLMSNNIPVPNFLICNANDNESNITDKMYSQKISFPIVLKPIDGTFGIDVITNIDNLSELKDSLLFFKNKNYNNIMLEEQIAGDCYRIFVFNNSVIDVIKREKPYVIGDGIMSIEKLIKERDRMQLKEKMFPTKNISVLYLKKQGYALIDILPKGEKLYITDIINMHNGARISRVPLNKIPKMNIDMFIKVNTVMDINCSGLDYLSNDITVDYNTNNSRILEVNGTPDTEIHTKLNSDEFSFFEKVAGNIF